MLSCATVIVPGSSATAASGTMVPPICAEPDIAQKIRLLARQRIDIDRQDPAGILDKIAGEGWWCRSHSRRPPIFNVPLLVRLCATTTGPLLKMPLFTIRL